MNDLLFDVDFVGEKTKAPSWVEFQINPELAPVLVSSTRSVFFVDKFEKGNIAKAAVRQPGKNFQAEILAAIVQESQSKEWGNVFPFNGEGLSKSIEYLKFFDFEEVDILTNPNSIESLELEEEEENPFVLSSWVPPLCLVVIPKQREYFGSCFSFGKQGISFIVHNAVRGIALAVDL